MELFIGIGAMWAVGIATYTFVSKKSTVKMRHRCNVKKNIIRFKETAKDLSESIKR